MQTAERCISYEILSDRLTIRPSVTLRYHAKTTQARIMGSSLYIVYNSPMTVVSS